MICELRDGELALLCVSMHWQLDAYCSLAAPQKVAVKPLIDWAGGREVFLQAPAGLLLDTCMGMTMKSGVPAIVGIQYSQSS